MEKINFKNILSRIPQTAGIIALISLVAQYGFYLDEGTMVFYRALDRTIAGIFVVSYLFNMFADNSVWKSIRSNVFESILFLVFLLSFILERVLQWQQNAIFTSELAYTYINIYYIIIQLYLVFNALLAFARNRDRWLFVSINPARVFVFSFFSIIILGMLLLKLPKATYHNLAWVDAFFVSTSAVCVTGLTPVNIVTTFTPIGQFTIMLLFQIGGLGIVTLTSFIALLFQQRGRFRLQDQVIMMEVLDDKNLSRMGEMLRSIIQITLSFELLGAMILWFRWGRFGLEGGQRVFVSIFHSISAYCNAGFSNIINGLETNGFNQDPLTMVTIMVLIVAGGLGFYTMRDLLFSRRYTKDHSYHLSLQTRMIILISGILILAGAVVVFFTQSQAWADMPVWLRVLNSFFTSITSRTAGFSTVNIGNLTLPAVVFIMLLMYIGAAPNSTGGGVKVTTIGSLLAAAWAFIRGKERVEIGWNTIPMNTIRRSLIVLIGSLMLIFSAVFLITLVEDATFIDSLFEVVSAFGTVGLTRGLTPYLSDFSKIVLTVVMFMGRVGLFTLAIAVGREAEQGHNYEYPETSLMVG